MKKPILYILLLSLLTNCTENIVVLKPIMYTDEPTEILGNSARLGGEVLTEGGLDVSEYGIVYSTTYPPTISDNKVIVGSRIGLFSSVFSNFSTGTTYYYAAYGINDAGAGYGDIYEFTTMEEAPCEPLNNYLDVTTDYSNINDGYYNSTDVDTYYPAYGNFALHASKGYNDSDKVEIYVFFQGNINDLLSGAYTTTQDFDYNSTLENAVVTMKHYNRSFLLDYNNTVYIEKQGNSLTVTLCDVNFSGNLVSTIDIDVDLNTRFTVDY